MTEKNKISKSAHIHEHQKIPDDTQLRIKAIQSLLIEKGGTVAKSGKS